MHPNTPNLPPTCSPPNLHALGAGDAVDRQVFDDVPGVAETRVGYTGGSNPRPSYRSVCAGVVETAACVPRWVFFVARKGRKDVNGVRSRHGVESGWLTYSSGAPLVLT